VEGLDVKGPFGNEGMFGARVPREVNRAPSSPPSMRLDDIDDPRLDDIVDQWHNSIVDDNILDFCQEVADSAADSGQPAKTPENLQRAIEAFKSHAEHWLAMNELPLEYAEPLIADSFDSYTDLSADDDEGVV